METTKNIYQRILGVMGDVDYIQKSDKKVNNQYRFVSHDQVNSVLHPMLVKHGIAVIPTVTTLTQEGNRTAVCLNVSFVNVDNPPDKIDISAWGYGIDQSDKGPGKAVSYAYKYAMLKAFCLETGDDPDEDQQTKFEPEKKAEPIPVPALSGKVISKADAAELELLLDQCDDVFTAHMRNYLKGLKAASFEQLPVEHYKKVRDRVLRKISELEGEEAHG